jgi:hypothetical protein
MTWGVVFFTQTDRCRKIFICEYDTVTRRKEHLKSTHRKEPKTSTSIIFPINIKTFLLMDKENQGESGVCQITQKICQIALPNSSKKKILRASLSLF